MASKKDLVSKVQEISELELNKSEATKLVDDVLNAIQTLTVENEKLQLIGFGNFEVRERAARKGRNPKTGEEMTIDASKGIGFKVSKNFKELVK
jgi:DNA-binding protein HU-beta